MSARAGLALLASVREALRTPEGRRLAREIRAALDTSDSAAADSYEMRLVARAFSAQTRARKGGRRPAGD